jgi:hypothetical protein
MCTTTESGSDGSNASFVMSETSERFSSSLCDADWFRIHLRITFVVGTMTICPRSVERVLAREERGAPDAALARLDHLAVRVFAARQVVALAAGVRDHDADVADLDDGLRHELDRREQAVHVVRAVDEHLMLAPAPPAGREEALGVLEVVVERLRVVRVVADGRRDDLALLERGPVVHGHDADHVVDALDHERVERLPLGERVGHRLEELVLAVVERQVVELRIGEDDELRRG